MRILIVHPSFWCYGGAELCIVKLANYLEDNGHKVTILTTQMIPDIREDLKCEIQITSHRVNFFKDLKEYFNKIFRDYDVINFHNHPSELLLEEKYPSVWFCNEPPDYVLDKGILPRKEKIRILNTISRVIVSDKRNARRFKHFYGIDPEIVHYGIDFEFWSNGQEDRYYFDTLYKFTILHSGMVHPRKNQFRSVLLLNNLKDKIKDLKLIFSGNIVHQKYFMDIQKYIEENNLQNKVKFLGGIDRRSLRDLYRSVDLLLHPIKDQGGWLTPFEAMASNLPVIISTEANPSDIIKENQIGIVVSNNDLEEAVLDYYRNEGKYKDMVRRGSSFVKYNLTWEKYSSNIEKILREVAK